MAANGDDRPKPTIRSKVQESLALMRTALSVGPFAEIGPHSVSGEGGVNGHQGNHEVAICCRQQDLPGGPVINLKRPDLFVSSAMAFLESHAIGT